MCFPAIFMLIFVGYLRMHVYPPSFKVQHRLQHYQSSRHTHTNILQKNIFARIWINFWRCEWSMITHFCLSPSCVTAGQLSWGQASILMFVCVSVLMWAPAKHHSLHVRRGKNCTAQIQTFTSHTDRISLKLVYQKRNNTHSACVFWTSGKIASFL